MLMTTDLVVQSSDFLIAGHGVQKLLQAISSGCLYVGSCL